MSKTKTKSFLIAIAAAMCALCLLLGTLAHGWTRAANELVKLDAYADQTIPENNAHDQEYNVFDANKKTDFGIRKPTFDADGNMTSALSGDPIGHPGANGMNIGNGISVDYGVAKLRMVYAGGGARYRYGYGVDFSNLNINLNFLDLNGRNGHLDLTFSNNYEAVSHSGLNYPGVTLAIYQDSVNYFQSALLSAHNRNAIEGLTSTNDNNNVMSFAVSADDPESYCFSIYTSKNADGSYSIQVMNKSAQIVYTIPASLESELVREDGTTNIGLN